MRVIAAPFSGLKLIVDLINPKPICEGSELKFTVFRKRKFLNCWLMMFPNNLYQERVEKYLDGLSG